MKGMEPGFYLALHQLVLDLARLGEEGSERGEYEALADQARELLERDRLRRERAAKKLKNP